MTYSEPGTEEGFGRFFGRAAAGFVDILLPPRCLGCGRQLGNDGGLCPECWGQVRFLSPPWCEVCGLPFEYDTGPGAVCGECLRRPPPWRRMRAAMAYGDVSRRMLLGFKHGDRLEAAPPFGRWLVAAGREILGDVDLVVPVPLHWTRLFMRRYNQSALLARELSRLTGIPLVADLLRRRRRTPPQGHLGRNARHDNVRGAFAPHPRRIGRLAGRKVLLVDDVMTTGATAAACAACLLRNGAVAVDVLTVARVMR